MLADVRHLLAHRLGGRPTRANFRTGTLTVCTMVPMRSVPHRVVCLLGLDDGVFPRSRSVDGDDVLARSPMTGERDVRSEDRQLFLDAILAARETLVVTYTGANEHTGAERPPAVPLGELLDALDTTASTTGGSESHVASTCSSSTRCSRSTPATWSPGELVGADARSASTAPPLDGRPGRPPARAPRLRAAPRAAAPRAAVADVALADLQAFVAHPVRAFLRSRLDVTAPLEAEETLDAIPLTLDGLDKWQDRRPDARPTSSPAPTPDDVGTRGAAAGRAPARTPRRPCPAGDRGPPQAALIAQTARAARGRAAHRRRRRRPRWRTPADRHGRRRCTATGSSRSPTPASPPSTGSRSWVDLLALSVGHPDQSWTRARPRPARAQHRARRGRPARPPGRGVAARPRRPLRPRHARAAADAGEDGVCVRRGGAPAAAQRQRLTAREGEARSGRPTASRRTASRARTPTRRTSRCTARTRRSSAC